MGATEGDIDFFVGLEESVQGNEVNVPAPIQSMKAFKDWTSGKEAVPKLLKSLAGKRIACSCNAGGRDARFCPGEGLITLWKWRVLPVMKAGDDDSESDDSDEREEDPEREQVEAPSVNSKIHGGDRAGHDSGVTPDAGIWKHRTRHTVHVGAIVCAEK